MSTPTSIPETPMGETEQDSYPKSKEKFQQQLQDIFQTILRLTGPDQLDQLCQWMEYKQYLTIDDFYDNSCDDPEKFDTKGPATEYKWKGKMNHLSANVAQKLKSFVRWMTHEDRPYELHDDFLATLTRESYLKFRHLVTQSLPTLPPSHHEPQQLMTSFPSEFKQTTQSESKTALNNFKKGPREMPLSTLSSRMASTMIHFRDHSWQISKHKASMMLLTLIMTLRVVISMNRNFSKESSPLYILFWLLHSKQKRGENWSKNFKEMPGPSF